MEDLAGRIRERVEDYADFPRPGIVFRDLTPVLRDPELTRAIARRLSEEAERRGATALAGIESRGFLFAAPAACDLGVPLLTIRKQGKLPGSTLTEAYDLEYGSAELELQAGSISDDGDRVLVVDDLLATGGTLAAACRLLESAGARVAGLAVVVELDGLDGRARLKDYNLLSLLRL